MLSTTDKMQLTLALAQEAMDHGECPIAAIVFLGDAIIAQSYTKEAAERRFLVHAELNALLEADLKRFSYEDRTHMQLFTNLEPCMMCMGAAMSSFIGEIYYALESPSDGAVELIQKWNPKSDDFASYKAPVIHNVLLRKESQEIFKKFADTCEPGGIKTFASGLSKL